MYKRVFFNFNLLLLSWTIMPKTISVPSLQIKKASPSTITYQALLKEKNGELWALGDYLSVITIGNDNQPIIEKIETNIPIESSSYMIEDDKGHIWASRDEGVYQITTELPSIHPYKDESPENQSFKTNYGGGYSQSYKLDATVCLCKDTEGNIYAGSLHKGLHVFDKENDMFINIPYIDGHILPVKHILALDNGNILLCTDGKGVKIYNIRSGEFTDYTFNGAKFDSNKLKAHCAIKDRDGNLWFALYQKGVAMIPKVSNSFGYIGYKSVKNNIIGTSCITSLYRGEKGTLWVSTDNDGIYGLTPNNQFQIHFTPSDTQPSVATIVTAIYEDTEGLIWIGGSGGLTVWNPHTQESMTYSIEDGLPSNTVYAIQGDENGIFSEEKAITIYISPVWWASIWAKGIYTIIAIVLIAFIIYQIYYRYRSRQKMLGHILSEEVKEAQLQFFINILHEIRSPISLIINPLQKLMSMDDDLERGKLYRIMYRNSERILRLINQLMDIHKIDKGKMKLSFQEVEIVSFINDICDTWAEQANWHDIHLLFHHKGIQSLNLWIDPNHFDKILLNLLSNSFKFTPDYGTIDIHLKEVQDNTLEGPLSHHAEIIVSDTGTGIPENEIARIFDRFYKTSHSKSTEGTGIGLHLTHSLVELHHGKIACKNNIPEPGCRFIIRIPIGKGHLTEEDLSYQYTSVRPIQQESTLKSTLFEEKAEEQTTEEKNKNVKHHILIVEDNEEICRYIALELSSKYHVRECANGKEALNEIFRKAPDLVISDIMMPEMDGLTLCKKLKNNIHLNHIPIILLTARAQEEDIIEALDRGADAYITKPFNSKILEKTISNLILSREKLKNAYSCNQELDNKLEKIEIESPDEKLMNRIMKVINNQMDNPNLTVEMIASEVGISRVHLNRKLKELTNQTAREFIKNCRLKQAALLFSEKKQSITEVAELTGFTNPSNFSTAFKELFGVYPSAYKKHIDSQQEHED